MSANKIFAHGFKGIQSVIYPEPARTAIVLTCKSPADKRHGDQPALGAATFQHMTPHTGTLATS
jgi:hypothetical protein